MTELLALRARDAAPCAEYPVPGEVPNSILLAHADGVPALFAVRRAVVLTLGGTLFTRHRRVVPAYSALIVTDCRTALASSTYSPGQGMLVGHIRHAWLTGIATADDAVRLTLQHPDGLRLALVVHLEGRTAAECAAREVVRRACGHDTSRFTTGEGGGRWNVLVARACAT